MATGYTSVIKDGISTRNFILRCARAFGACIMQRDDKMDVLPLKMIEPSDYHQEKIDALLIEHNQLRNMSHIELDEAVAKEYEDCDENLIAT